MCDKFVKGADWEVKRKSHCSWDCYVKDMKQNPHHVPRWKGGVLPALGYLLIKSWDHPFHDKRGYVREHRLVMEKIIGRYLDPKLEEVHHINGNKSDNRPENLMVVDSLTHNRLEHGWELVEGKWFKNCPLCKRYLEVNYQNFWPRKWKTNYVGGTSSKCKDCMNAQRREKWRKRKDAHNATLSTKNGE